MSSLYSQADLMDISQPLNLFEPELFLDHHRHLGFQVTGERSECVMRHRRGPVVRDESHGKSVPDGLLPGVDACPAALESVPYGTLSWPA